MADFAQESGHWYRPDGAPAYTMTGANGKERAVTLRDARKENLYPSVTGVIRMASAPALEKWKRNQVLLAALTLPRIADEAESAWLVRVEHDWQEQGKAAAEKGTAIHGAIEKHYKGIPTPEWFDWAIAAADAIETACGTQRWSAERSFADVRGYGGKTDLHSGEWVIDVKTKDGAPDGKLYDEHIMQLSAYREGLGLPGARAGILFVQRETPSAAFVEASQDELTRGFSMFSALLQFWKYKNNYAPVRP